MHSHKLTSTIQVTAPDPTFRRQQEKPATRILVAAPNGLLRYGLSSLLNEEFRAAVTETGSAEEALSMLGEGTWKLFVLDPALPEIGWQEILTKASSIQPHVPVLVFASHPDTQTARRALRIGAMGYVSKKAGLAELKFAIQTLLERNRYVSADALEPTDWRSAVEVSVQELLSQREFDVLQGLLSGKSISNISQDFSISVKSVSTYRARILTKLGVENNMALMRYAMQHNLL